MGPTPGSSLEKATFTNLDTRAGFTVQFNPAGFHLDDRARWRVTGAPGPARPPLVYERGEPSVLRMELVFDTTDTSDNVFVRYVQPLRALLTDQIDLRDASGAAVGRRPPHCRFAWGDLQLQGVVEALATSFLLFQRDGTPLRARVALTFREAPAPRSEFASGGASRPSVHQVRPGDTLPLIAAATGVSARDIAVANGIDDPFQLTPGRTLQIPSSSDAARALAAARRRTTPGTWRTSE